MTCSVGPKYRKEGRVTERRQNTRMLLQLMRAALCQIHEPIVWTGESNVQSMVKLIVEQSLVPMLYPVIQWQSGPAWAGLAGQLKPIYDRELHRGLIQEYEIQALLDDMERDGIDCLPMKGWIMRDYYPEPLMRSMSDLDVLVREMNGPDLQKWMETRGYTPEHIGHDVHDSYAKPPYMNIELHRRLIDEEQLKQQHTVWRENCLVSLWQKEYLQKEKKHIYRLSDEDFLVYQLLHFYRHFTNSGVGIRPLADLYLFLEKKRQTLDHEYLKKQLESLYIFAFFEQMARLASVCFEGLELDENAWLVLDYLTDAGIYGDRAILETSHLFKSEGRTVRESKWKNFLGRCFLPLASMKNNYPRLRRDPWLLPVYWGLRIGRIVFLEPYKISAVWKYQTQDRYDQMRKIYRAAGVLGESTK